MTVISANYAFKKNPDPIIQEIVPENELEAVLNKLSESQLQV